MRFSQLRFELDRPAGAVQRAVRITGPLPGVGQIAMQFRHLGIGPRRRLVMRDRFLGQPHVQQMLGRLRVGIAEIVLLQGCQFEHLDGIIDAPEKFQRISHPV